MCANVDIICIIGYNVFIMSKLQEFGNFVEQTIVRTPGLILLWQGLANLANATSMVQNGGGEFRGIMGPTPINSVEGGVVIGALSIGLITLALSYLNDPRPFLRVNENNTPVDKRLREMRPLTEILTSEA